MSKVKFKMQKSGNNANGAQIADMFRMMSGADDAPPSVIIPKICEVRNKVRHILNVLNQFATLKIIRDRFEKFSRGFTQILDFCESCKNDLILQDSQPEKGQSNEDRPDDYKNVPKEKINLIYRGIKNSNTIQQITIMTSVLKKFKDPLENFNKTKENFINTEPGSSLFIFRFSDLDFKVLWADNNMDSYLKLYTATVFKLLLHDGEDIYNIITSADIDPEEFAKNMTNALCQMENQREISNCRDAFKAMRQGSSLLKNKMNDYYRESVIAENPSLMFTSFLTDVINAQAQGEEKASKKLRAQFMRICGFIQKQSQKRGVNDPTMKKMLSNVNVMYQVSKSKDMNMKKTLINQISGINVDNDINNLNFSGITQHTQNNQEIKKSSEQNHIRNHTENYAKTHIEKTGTQTTEEETKNGKTENQTNEKPEDELSINEDIVLDESDEELLKEDDLPDETYTSLKEISVSNETNVSI